MKTKVEKKNSIKQNKCGKCGNRGHNKRTCTFGENPETEIIEEEDDNEVQINLMEDLDK